MATYDKNLKNEIAQLMQNEESFRENFIPLIENALLTIDLLKAWQQMNPNFEKTNEVIELNKDELLKNPYLRDIQIKTCHYGNIMLANNRVIHPKKIEFFDEIKRDVETFELMYKYCYLEDEICLPAISEKEYSRAWMTIEPLEINTFKEFIENAHGNVLLLGCGLGYVAYMLSLKPKVRSVTIVDMDEKILSIFSEAILPQFINSHKIKTVHADGIEYLKNSDLSQYDCVNVDIWRDVSDMIGLYLPCLEIEVKYPDIEFSYWIEDSLKEFLQRNILRYFAGMPNDWPIYSAIAKDIVDNTDIRTQDDLREVIKLEDMRSLLYNWYMNNLELFKKLDEENRALFRSILINN